MKETKNINDKPLIGVSINSMNKIQEIEKVKQINNYFYNKNL